LGLIAIADKVLDPRRLHGGGKVFGFSEPSPDPAAILAITGDFFTF
jgi:hypothetical protein